MTRRISNPGITEFGGGLNLPNGSDAAEEARAMRRADPEDAGSWPSADAQRARRQR